MKFSEKGTRWISMAAMLSAMAGLAHVSLGILRTEPLPPAREPSSAPVSIPRLEAIDPGAWKIFHAGGPALADNPQQAKYRLAGTFFAAVAPDAEGDGVSGQRAILDDLTTHRQHLVAQDQQIGPYTVAVIERNRVVLRNGLEELELTIGFRNPAEPSRAALASNGETLPGEDTVMEVTQLGKRVGETRWVIEKDKIRGYYEQLMDAPERLANLYLSMKADFQEGVVAGYRLQPAGEQEFFKDIGLHEGDIIRRVNSMNMVSQNRAEYFIREFAKDRLGAVVLEIERNGQEERLVYLIR